MKELATIAAVLCVAVIAVIAAPRSTSPTSLDGPDGGTPTHRAAITVPSRPADFQYGLTGNAWWAAQGHKVAHSAD